eukprot:7253070-Alexandrium_andersonii.AAC.1
MNSLWAPSLMAAAAARLALSPVWSGPRATAITQGWPESLRWGSVKCPREASLPSWRHARQKKP